MRSSLTPRARSGAPPPSPGAPAATPALVGRDRELALLRAALDAALEGQGSLVLISGEAGIGKTALAEALCREATDQGTLVLAGRCYDLTETPPYAPWIELFGRYRPGGGPPVPDAFARHSAAGETASEVALFNAVQDFLATAAAQRPLAVLLDDLHWADPASLELLRLITRAVATLPMLIVVTYRVDELTRRHPLYTLLPLLVREVGATRLDLRPLGVDALRALIGTRYRLGPADTARLTTYLQGRAEGNPFFLGELLRTIEEEGILRPTDGAWTLGDLRQLRVPPLLRHIIDGRLARLDEETQRLLGVAAVIGQEAPLAIWAAVGDADEERLAATIEQAAAAHVLDETPEGTHARFVHALIREALYEGVLPSRRRRLHRRVGEALVALPDPDPVAYHFRQAGDPRAGEWLIRAGEWAENTFAYETAAARFEEALPFLEGDAAQVVTQAETFLRLARLRRLDTVRGVRYAQEALRLATESRDLPLTAVARHRLAINLCFTGRFHEGIVMMDPVSMVPDTLPAAVIQRFFQLDRISATGWYRRASYALRLAQVGRVAEAERHAIAARAEGERRRDIPANASLALTVVYPVLGRVAEAHAMFAETRAYCLSVQEFEALALTVTSELHSLVIPYHADEPSLRGPLIQVLDEALRRCAGPVSGLPRWALLHGFYYLDGRWDDLRPLVTGLPVPFLARDEVTLIRVALARGELTVAGDLIARLIPEGLTTEPGNALLLDTMAGQRLAAALALTSGDLATARAWLAAHDRWLAWSGAVLGRAEGQILWATYLPRNGRARARQRARAACAGRGYAALPAARPAGGPPPARRARHGSRMPSRCHGPSGPGAGASRRLRRALRERPHPACDSRAARGHR